MLQAVTESQNADTIDSGQLRLNSEQVLSLLPWNTCNARCAHCGPNSGPTDKTAIHHERCLELISEAGRLYQGDWCLTLSGGEVFLFYDRLLEYVTCAREHNGYTTLISNCFWATSPQRAEELLRPLIDQDLRVLGISLTQFHQEYVDPKRVGIAIEAARKLKLRVRVRSVASKTSRLWELLRAVEGAHPWFVQFMEMPLVPHGRAEQLPEDDLFFADELPTGTCPAASLTINPSGKGMVCCNGGGDLEPLQVGDVDFHSLEQLEYLFASDPTLRYLVRRGPSACIDFLSPDEAEKVRDSRYVNECDLCIKLFRDEKRASLIKERINNEAMGEILPVLEELDVPPSGT